MLLYDEQCFLPLQLHQNFLIFFSKVVFHACNICLDLGRIKIPKPWISTVQKYISNEKINESDEYASKKEVK